MTAAQSTLALIWSDKKSIGSSREAYFGSITPGDEVIYVQKVIFVDQPDLWEVRWNVGCHPNRKVENSRHSDLYVAIAAAEVEVGQLLANPVPVCNACGLMLELGTPCKVQQASHQIHG